MVPLPGVKEDDSTGAILTGCSRLESNIIKASGSIYKLTWSPNGQHLIWKRLPQVSVQNGVWKISKSLVQYGVPTSYKIFQNNRILIFQLIFLTPF